MLIITKISRISGLVEQLTALERVANTPIPISCKSLFISSRDPQTHKSTDAIHLKQCVTLYLFALPLTLVNDLGWGTVPVVTAVAFTFMGIEGIADEIEMPFGLLTCHIIFQSVAYFALGHDERDLPLGAVLCNIILVP